MKLVYVPDWLSSYLNETNQPLSNLSSSLTVSIVSKTDVINYYKAQYEFAKFLFNGIDSNMIYRVDPMQIMLHNSTLPEVQLYFRTQSKDIVAFNTLVTSLESADNFDFDVEHDPNCNVVYIIGRCAETPAWRGGRYSNLAAAIIGNIFKVGQSHLRVENQFTDKGTVLRENPILTQLYVKSIVS